MKDGTIEIDGNIYRPVKAEYGKCCDMCDIGQMQCSFECQEFEENESEYLAMKLTDKITDE